MRARPMVAAGEEEATPPESGLHVLTLCASCTSDQTPVQFCTRGQRSVLLGPSLRQDKTFKLKALEIKFCDHLQQKHLN